MSTIYTPANAYHSSITVPSPGDGRTASSVNTPIEAIADNAAWANARLAGANRVIQIQNNAIGAAGWGGLGAYVTTIGSSPGPYLAALTGALSANDIVVIQASLSMTVASGAAAPMFVRLETKQNYAGSGTTLGDATSEQEFNGSTLGTFPGISITSLFVASVGGPLGIFINGHATGTGAPSGSWATVQGSVLYTVYRVN